MFRERFNTILKKFLIWRLRNVSDRSFLMALSILTGVAVGLAAVLLKNTVHFIRLLVIKWFPAASENYLFIIAPVIGILLAVLFVRYVVRRQVSPGVAMVLHSKSQRKGRIDRHNMFSHLVGSSLTVGFGGSVGLEGPTVATGSALGSNIGYLFHLKEKQIILLLGCACTGAMAAIFKAPIAAIVFALEVIMLDLTMSSLIPLLLASVSAALTSYLFLGNNVIYFVEKIDPFLMSDIPFYIAIGVLSAFLSVYFTKVYNAVLSSFEKTQSWIKRFVVGSIILGVLIFLFPGLYGEGYEVINASLHGNFDFLFDNTVYYSLSNNLIVICVVFVLILLLKAFATAVTFGAGGIGGIFAPSLFIGANLGLFFAQLCKMMGFNVSSTNLALVGMAGTIAGVIHAPLTAVFLIAELTAGYSLFIPLMIVSTISYVIAKMFMPNSLYTIQLAKRGHLETHHKDKAVLSRLKVDKLIECNFITVKGHQSMRELIHAIEKSTRNIYPVIDDYGKLEGIVFLDHIRHIMFKQELYDSTLVSDLMFMPEPLVNINETVETVAEKFELSGNFNLPVVDDDGKYIGFISRAKVFTQYRRLTKKFSED